MGAGTGSRRAVPAAPVTEPALRPSRVNAVAVTFAPGEVPAPGRTVTASEESATSGVSTSESTDASGTGSIQTVCQMPELGVYQMPLGLRDCLPSA